MVCIGYFVTKFSFHFGSIASFVTAILHTALVITQNNLVGLKLVSEDNISSWSNFCKEPDEPLGAFIPLTDKPHFR